MHDRLLGITEYFLLCAVGYAAAMFLSCHTLTCKNHFGSAYVKLTFYLHFEGKTFLRAFHTVSSQDFRSFHFLVKTGATQFFCEIATFTSRLLLFDEFFSHGLDYRVLYDFQPDFLLEAGQILERSYWIQILWLTL